MSTSPTPARAGRSCPLRALKKEAARANGAKSHGPKTPEGKLASSRNALAHGLTARTVVLQNESEAEYEAELSAYLDHFLPQGKPETDLVHQLAAAQWRLARYVAVEAALLEQKMDDQADWVTTNTNDISDHHRLAIAFESLAGANGSLALLNRYQARLHREYQRLLKTLTELQAARLAREPALHGKTEITKRTQARPVATRRRGSAAISTPSLWPCYAAPLPRPGANGGYVRGCSISRSRKKSVSPAHDSANSGCSSNSCGTPANVWRSRRNFGLSQHLQQMLAVLRWNGHIRQPMKNHGRRVALLNMCHRAGVANRCVVASRGHQRLRDVLYIGLRIECDTSRQFGIRLPGRVERDVPSGRMAHDRDAAGVDA